MSIAWGVKKLCFTLVVLSGLAGAQTLQVQPYLAGGGALLGSGMTAAGASVAGGAFFTGKHFMVTPEATYQTGGKASDNDNTSSKGHERFLRGDALLRFGKYYIGPGIDWNQLNTPDYVKGSTSPRFTVGRDFSSEAPINRLMLTYVGVGNDHANGIQGIEAQAWWFFGTRHLFMRMTIDGSWGHATVIPVSQGGSPQSVASELATRVLTSQFQALMGWRF